MTATALDSAISLIQSAQGIAAQAQGSTVTPEQMQIMATQVQGIQQQMATLANTTVAGIPARVVGRCTVAEPALEMDASFPFTLAEGGGI